MEPQIEYSEFNFNSRILEKVLYVGSVHPESTSFARYEALKKRASFIDLIDTKPPQSFLFKMKFKFLKGKGLNFDIQLKVIIQDNLSRNQDQEFLKVVIYY